jgi:hypothetical protein
MSAAACLELSPQDINKKGKKIRIHNYVDISEGKELEIKEFEGESL